MARSKKLQVFVSSTYTDLREERQAAVGGILTAGHIPAGMELFAAMDQSQMAVIRQWIDESDVFMLILGGRYGSVEPQSGKSYIHLEYEYALQKGKPFFAIVIEEDYLKKKVKKFGVDVIETSNPQKFKEFQASVLKHLVKFWADPRDIELAVLKTLSEFSRRPELVGWVPGDEAIRTAVLAEELARLTKENAQLREQLAQAAAAAVTYNGLTFHQMYNLLLKEPIDPTTPEIIQDQIKRAAEALGDQHSALVHSLWILGDQLAGGGLFSRDAIPTLNRLEGMGIVTSSESDKSRAKEFFFTDEGRRFFLRLLVERGTEAARKHIVQRSASSENAKK